ncbi:L,D-transpeptidase [Nocardia salmonicida]|uniref:L,D-transpeptidase n=1 Tax=Nocardia salmonicida TaxID=53431 RepID=UPI0007A403A9|nr:Ig-like domain-containing protein [Nocardia salmonicida]
MARSHRATVAIVALATVATLLVAACTSSAPSVTPPTPSDTRDSAESAQISIVPAPGTRDADPGNGSTVSASDGILAAVTMTNEQGTQIEGVLTPDKSMWKPLQPLGYGRTYTVTAEAVTLTGRIGPQTATFSTITPRNQTKVYLTTAGGQSFASDGRYGVGTVVVAHFDEDIPDRAAAEARLSVTADPPADGSWYWVDDRNAHWRPRQYWAPGTKVSVAADIYGAQLGPGLYGQEDARETFTVGAARVSIADDNTKEISVYENGNLIRTMPTSMGMGGSEVVAGTTITFWTQPGTYTVMDKANPVIMDSSTYGLPVNSRLGYKETINWATRISTDGIYLHALESSIWAQGNTNVSHGCLNLSPANAEWFFNFSQPGDVVEVRNTGGAPLEVWQNGDWSVSWDQWQQGSALR